MFCKRASSSPFLNIGNETEFLQHSAGIPFRLIVETIVKGFPTKITPGSETHPKLLCSITYSFRGQRECSSTCFRPDHFLIQLFQRLVFCSRLLFPKVPQPLFPFFILYSSPFINVYTTYTFGLSLLTASQQFQLTYHSSHRSGNNGTHQARVG